MKVLYVSHFLPYPPHGGAFQRMYNLFKEASKESEIYFYSFTQDKFLDNKNSRDGAIKHLSQFAKEIKVFKTPVDISKFNFYWLLFLNIFSRNPYSVPFFYSKELEEAILEALDKVDLVYFETIALAPYVKLCEGRNIKTILGHQNVESDLLTQRAKSETNILKKIFCYIQGKKLQSLEDKIIPEFDLNITVSKEDKERFLDRNLKSKFEVVENGTDISYFTPAANKESEKPNLVFAGSLDWHANDDGVRFFINDILPSILKKEPNIKFNIFGRAASSSLTYLVSQTPAAILHGFVDDVRPHIHAASVYIVPLRVGGGSRLKILDAMASEKAIVSTSIGAEGLEVTDKENILIADTPKEFAEAIELLINDRTKREYLARNGRKLVEKKYSWERIAEGMVGHWRVL